MATCKYWGTLSDRVAMSCIPMYSCPLIILNRTILDMMALHQITVQIPCDFNELQTHDVLSLGLALKVEKYGIKSVVNGVTSPWDNAHRDLWFCANDVMFLNKALKWVLALRLSLFRESWPLSQRTSLA